MCHRDRSRAFLAAATVFVLTLAACSGDESGSSDGGPAPNGDELTADTQQADDVAPVGSEPTTLSALWPTDPRAVEPGAPPLEWRVDVVALIAHDSAAFTQGLELVDGWIYESTGGYGESSVRRIDPATGRVEAEVALDDALFGEGLTASGDTLIQLTWREGQALVWDRTDLTLVGTHRYDGDGWGICSLDETLIMSDGSDRLVRRNPIDFEIESTIEVRLAGTDVQLLNELECIDGLILANVWPSDDIIVINPDTGDVLAVIDASAVASAVDRPDDGRAVLNGIADLGDGRLLLGGKWWPHHVVVTLTTAAG